MYIAAVRYALALVTTFAIAACADPEIDQLTRVKTEVCACKTTTCAEAALAGVPQREVKASHRAQQVARDMLDCLAKLSEADKPVTDPDAPAAAGGAVNQGAGSGSGAGVGGAGSGSRPRSSARP
jgi:hypothetical protein